MCGRDACGVSDAAQQGRVVDMSDYSGFRKSRNTRADHVGDADIIDFNQAAAQKAADADAKRSIGSLKLYWLEKLMSARPEIDHPTYRVAACIAFTINQGTQQARISDLTVAHKTGICPTQVRVARMKLRDLGWLIWKRTRDTNLYKLLLLERNVRDIEDRQTILRDKRKEARKTRQI